MTQSPEPPLESPMTSSAALPFSLQVPDGPGMTMFGPDGRYAFVCSSFTPETVVIDASNHTVIARLPQSSKFCPNIAVTPDNRQVRTD